MSWKYKKGDFVRLDFSRCDPKTDITPGGLFFSRDWRDTDEGDIVQILDLSWKPGTYFTERYMIDEYCIEDKDYKQFNTEGLTELI